MLQGDKASFQYRRRKRVLKRIFTVFFLFVLTSLIYSLISLVFGSYLRGSIFNQPTLHLLAVVSLIGLLFKPLDHLSFLLCKNVIFSRRDDHFYTLSKLAKDAMSILDLNELANLVVNTFGEVVHVRTASLLVYQPNDSVYEVTSAFGISPAYYRKIRLSVDRPIVDTLRTFGEPIVRERIRKLLPWQEANTLTTEFELLQAACVIPIIHEDQLIGSLNLSPHTASESFKDSDIRFFFQFAVEIAPSLRNAITMNELKQANEELKKVQAELIQSTQLTAIEQLATGLAHEIHNPLTIISGKAQVLLLKKDKKVYDEQVEEVLKTIVKQTKRAADITRKLLMFSQGRSSADEPIQFEQIVNDTVALISYQMSLDDIRVVQQVDKDLPNFFASASAFREVFLNLLLNAIQAIGKSGEIHIRVRHKLQDGTIEVRVADTGVGIDEKNLSQIFNPFSTTRSEGTGLGLFITQQIVHRYHGSIRVESRLGEGTVVIIRLPLSSGGQPASKSNGPELSKARPVFQINETE